MNHSTCSVDDCHRPIHSKALRLCNAHYQQQYHGKPFTKTRNSRIFGVHPCATEGCDRESRTQGMCEMHYHAEYRQNVGHEIACERCGKITSKPTSRARFCSRSCAQYARTTRGKRSTPLSRAYASGDMDAVREALWDLSSHQTECWIWNMALNATGYGITRAGGKNVFAHRLSLEAKLGQPLGRMQAHHVCANRACVNPEHLDLVTQKENIAEMLHRRTFTSRIIELEDALRSISPGHTLLHEGLTKIAHT